MKMLIRSYRRAETITTPTVPAFADLERHVLLHDVADVAAYNAAGRLGEARTFLTNAEPGPGGLVRNTELGIRALADPGEWIVLADDDISEVQAVPLPWSELSALDVHDPGSAPDVGWDALFRTPVGAEGFVAIVAEAIARAESIGSHVVGFGTTKNFYFRGRKWRTVGYVMGGLRLWRYDPGYAWDDSVGMEDFRDSAEQLRRYGTVLINNYVHAVCGMYGEGGMGDRSARLEQRELDIRALDLAYPGLLRVHRKGTTGYPDLRIRLTSDLQVERWRRTVMSQRSLGL